MLEKIKYIKSDIYFKGSLSSHQNFAGKIKNDYVKTPDVDEFMSKPKVKTYSQSLAELEKTLGNFWMKDEILEAVNKNNIDVINELAKIKNSYKNEIPPYYMQLKTIAQMVTPDNKDLIIKMAKVKDTDGNLVHRAQKLVISLKLQDDIKYKSVNLSDKKILEYINKNNTFESNKEKLQRIDEVLDIYHTFNKSYSHIASEWERPSHHEYYNFTKDNLGFSQAKLSKLSNSKKFINEIRTERLKEFCKTHPNDEMSDYFYNDYYLKSTLVPKEVKPKCSEINEKFNTKIFLANNHEDDIDVLDFVDEELSEWKRASNGEAILPPIIDFSTINKGYIDENSLFGISAADGFQDPFTHAISVNDTTLDAVRYVLRHEITHANDLKRGNNIPEKYDLEEILDCRKYKEEFYNAGIDEELTEYAHNNTNEYKAVAAQGDMSKYSASFKRVLIDFGMPEWMFKMQPTDTLYNEIYSKRVDKMWDRLDRFNN